MQQQQYGESSTSGDAFWRFSLAFYARPGVAEALIALQDRAGLDVNLILFALWRGIVHGHHLDKPELNAAEATIAPLRRGVVMPLRDLRRRLKGDSDPDLQQLRPRVARFELVAERRVQCRLALSAVPANGGGNRRAAAQENLALYLGAEAKSAEAEVLRLAITEFTTRC